MSEEPEILTYGRRFIKDYEELEFRKTLSIAFIEGKADFITLELEQNSTKHYKFLSACVAWAIDKNLLYHDHTDCIEQKTISYFRLSSLGKQYLELKEDASNKLNGLYPMSPGERAEFVVKQIIDDVLITKFNPRRKNILAYLAMHFNYLQESGGGKTWPT